jgi:ATP-dependent DNA ligase
VIQINSLPERTATFIEPMECLAVAKLPEGSQWLYEIKLDGYRAIAVKADDDVQLLSRRKKSFNRQFATVAAALAGLPENTVVDGEIVALDDEGRPKFNLLQHSRSSASRICYFIFDLLIHKGHDLTRLPLLERRQIMSSELKFRSPRIRIADYFETKAVDMVSAVRAQGLEGVVAKRKDGFYPASPPIFKKLRLRQIFPIAPIVESIVLEGSRGSPFTGAGPNVCTYAEQCIRPLAR